ncbi:MAG TPA: hypothetical protein VHW74_12790 [Mycobacteriales bacterium]|nr:hypothetical protein [Mycobacteriales bacterium]
MAIDESMLADALQTLDVDVPVDLARRARLGGRRRLVRRRSYVAAGAVGVAAVAVPSVLVLRGTDGGKVEPGAQSSTQAVYSDLYAAPPAPGSQCQVGGGGSATLSAYRDLLLLPPEGQPVTDASVMLSTLDCPPPHVALTALKTDGDQIVEGLVIYGPNAPTPMEVGIAGPNVHFGGQAGELAVDGQPAREYTFSGSTHTDVYWSEPDGGQWRASLRGMTQQQAVDLLNQMTFDGKSGTAVPPQPTADQWTVEPAVTDTSTSAGEMTAHWTDAEGHQVGLVVTQGPDQVDQLAAGGPAEEYAVVGYVGSMQLVTVRGHDGVIGAGESSVLFWQEAPDVEAELSITHGGASEIEQVANSLMLTAPDDSRFEGKS